MRSVSAKNIGFFNNLKEQVHVAVNEVTNRINLKGAITQKPALEGNNFVNLRIKSMAIDLRRMVEKKTKNYEAELFSKLIKSKFISK